MRQEAVGKEKGAKEERWSNSITPRAVKYGRGRGKGE